MLVEPESRTGAKLNVLCAEDNAFERSAIAELFRSTNETYLANGTPMQFEVHLVPSIDAVLAALSTAHEPFSIVMLDVNLGSDESSETIIGLVREEVGERVPIVLFSATAHMDQARVASARPSARVASRSARRPRPSSAPPRAHSPSHPQLPARSQVRRCLLLGADAYVTKPLPLGFFIHLWQYCLRRDPHFFAGITLAHRNDLPDAPGGGELESDDSAHNGDSIRMVEGAPRAGPDSSAASQASTDTDAEAAAQAAACRQQ